MRLALAIIAKGEVGKLRNIIYKYHQYFNEIVIAIDDEGAFHHLTDHINDDIELGDLPKGKIKLFKYEWRDDFAHKRNFLAGKIESEYYMRIDTDDEIDKPELLRQAFQEYVKQGFTLIHFMYYYSFDKSGNCNAKHWRETIIKNDGNLRWNKAIHENIIPKTPRKVYNGRESLIGILHKATQEEHDKSSERNLKLLMKELDATKDKPDARTTGYVARMLFGLKRYKEAIGFFEQFLANSGWDDDRYFAWLQLSECYQSMANGDSKSPLLETSLSCAVEAFLMKPQYPDAYFRFLMLYFDKKEYKKAIDLGTIGFTKETPDTMLIIDPSIYTWRPTAMMATCYMQLGQFKEALKLIEHAHKIVPEEQTVTDLLNFLREIYIDSEAAKDYLRLMNYTKHDLKRFRSLVASVPKKIAGDERILALKQNVEPGKKWDDKSVVFYCGGAWEDWVDSSVIGGIGGSEEATIYLAREFTKLGYKVTVYNQCGELAGTYKGVEYKKHWDFNAKDDFNILISWRYNIFSHKGIKAKKRIIWLHDVPAPDQFLEEDVDTYDKVLVLSEYHKGLLKNVPEDKIFVTRNGLNLSDFDGIQEQRNPKRCIYASSYDRGLEPLLEIIWPKVLKEVPDAELHIYYGWNTYDEMIKVGRRSAAWKEKMVKLMAQKGVTEHGRIGHIKLAREYAKSGLWVYPTLFTEISCIGAMRAQATGAVPVVNNYAALRETVKCGIRVEGDVKDPKTYLKYADKLILMLKHPDSQQILRKKMIPKAKELFGWQKVASEWNKNLFSFL